MRKSEIKILRLTKDICYIIGGFFGGEMPNSNDLTFVNDAGSTVFIRWDDKVLLAQDDLTRMQLFALQQLATDNSLGFDIFNDD